MIKRLQDSCWRVARTSTLERKMLWHRGIRAAVCLAPITPAGAQAYDRARWLSNRIGGSGQRSAWPPLLRHLQGPRGLRAAVCLAVNHRAIRAAVSAMPTSRGLSGADRTQGKVCLALVCRGTGVPGQQSAWRA